MIASLFTVIALALAASAQFPVCPNTFNVWTVTDRTFSSILGCEEALQLTLNLGIWTKNFTTISFPNLEYIKGHLTINVNYDGQLAGGLSFPNLREVGGAIRIATSGAGNTALLGSVSFPALETVGSGIVITTQSGGIIGDVTVGSVSNANALSIGSSINIFSGGSNFRTLTGDFNPSDVTHANIGTITVHNLRTTSDITIDAANSSVAGLYVNKETPNTKLEFFGRFYARNYWGESSIGDVEIYGIKQIVSIYLETREGTIGNTIFSGSDAAPMRVFSGVSAFTWTNWYWIQLYPTWIFYETFNMGSIGNIQVSKVEKIGFVRLEARYSPIGSLSINGNNWEVNNGEILINTWYNSTGTIGDVTITGLATLRGNLRFVAYNASIGNVQVNSASSTELFELFGSIVLNTWITETGTIGNFAVHGLQYIFGSISISTGAGDIGSVTVSNGANADPTTITGSISVQTGSYASGNLGNVQITGVGIVYGSVTVAPGAAALGLVEISGNANSALQVRSTLRVDPGTFSTGGVSSVTFNFIGAAGSVVVAGDINTIGSVVFNGVSSGFTVTPGSFAISTLSSASNAEASNGAIGSVTVNNFAGAPLGGVSVSNNLGNLGAVSFNGVASGASLKSLSLTGSSTDAGSVASVTFSNLKNIFGNVNIAPGKNTFGSVQVGGFSLAVSGSVTVSQSHSFIPTLSITGLASISSGVSLNGNLASNSGVITLSGSAFTIGSDLSISTNSLVSVSGLQKVGRDISVPIQTVNNQGGVTIAGSDLEVVNRVNVISYINASRSVTFTGLRIVRGGSTTATITASTFTFFSVYRANSIFTNPAVSVNGVVVSAIAFTGGYQSNTKLNDPGCINQCNGRGTAAKDLAGKCTSPCVCFAYNEGANCNVENICAMKPNCDCKSTAWSSWFSARGGNVVADPNAEANGAYRTRDTSVATAAGFTCASVELVGDNACVANTEYETSPRVDGQTHRVCSAVSPICNKATHFQTAAPTTTSNRVCSLLDICTSEEYESVAPTSSAEGDYYVSDRTCAALTQCTAGSTYESTSPSSNVNRECSACQNCASIGSIEGSPCTVTSNTQCQGCKSCVSGQYVLTACNIATNQDTQCEPCSTCSFPSEYQSAPCSSTGANTQCLAVKSCTAGEQYTSVAPTPNSDRECTDYSVVCDVATQYQVSDRTESADRVCANLKQACNFNGDAFEVIPSGGRPITSDRTCQPLTPFNPATQYISVAATETSDRTVETLTVCNYPTEYESVAATLNSNRQCLTSTVCVLGVTYETAALTTSSNRVCANVAPACQGGQTDYESSAPTLTSNRVCTPLNTCTSSQYESQAPTSSTARVCSDITDCTSTQFETAAPTATSNRQCQNHKTCASSEYIVTAGTSTADTVCEAISTCGAGEFEVTAPVAGVSNRVCQGWKVCSTSEYQTAEGTSSTDRQCTSTTPCVLGVSYLSKSATATTDAECRSLKECFNTEYQSRAATLTSDRVCMALKVCTTSQYEYGAPTATSDRLCAAVFAPCNTTTQYEFKAPTATSQRVCYPLTVCTTSQVQFVAPTYSTNRFCVIAPCNTATQYESRAPSFNVATQTLVTRVCSALTPCSTSQTEFLAPTYSTNRICHTAPCPYPTQYEVRAPVFNYTTRTFTLNRWCGTVAAACTTSQVQTVAPNYSTNRVCKTKCSASVTTSTNCPSGQSCYYGASNVPTCFNPVAEQSSAPADEVLPGVSGTNFTILAVLGAVGLIAIVIAAVTITRRRRADALARQTSASQMLSYENPTFDTSSSQGEFYHDQSAKLPLYDVATENGNYSAAPAMYDMPESAPALRETKWLDEIVSDNFYDNVKGNDVVADASAVKKEGYLFVSDN